jgi:alginate O-acetyltransferase complex protein AlgI
LVFSDPAFLLLFLPIAALLILSLARMAHSLTILCVSLVFYFWSSGWIVSILVFSIVFNWGCALALQRDQSRAVLAFGLCVNLGVLAYFKYALFFATEFDHLFQGNLAGNFRNIVLPIGISFFTFQGVSYLIDVYRRDLQAEGNVIFFGAYLSFFPQLIAGPIVRYRDVIAQYHSPDISLDNLSRGIVRFTHGLLKKIVIADSAGAIADACFGLPAEQYGFAASWLGTIAYTLQIYFDFSAYSDMAIGLGLAFGVRFHENFRHPYSATSVTEFWRRWHISLSTWFRDYLYVPLGGNRQGNLATYRNLLIVFLVTGLWHGAAWTFVLWGLYHGAFLMLERLFWGAKAKEPKGVWLRYLYLLPVVMSGWILFRAETAGHAWAMWLHLFQPGAYGLALPAQVAQTLTPSTVLSAGIGLGIFFAGRDRIAGIALSDLHSTVQVSWIRLVYTVLGLPLAIMLAVSSEFSPFLYFRF